MKTKLDIFHGFSEIPTDYEGACYITELETIFYLKDQFTRHRLDGPAVLYSFVDGTIAEFGDEFWVDGTCYTEEEYWNHPLVVEEKLKSILLLT